MSELIPGLLERYAHVCAELEAARKAASRTLGSVKLLAVGKTFGPEALLLCAEAGQRAFGENYAQEACGKIDWFKAHRPELDLEWHFIGPLQSNKTRIVAEHFDWVQTIDRLKIAERLSNQRPADRPDLNVLIEVNIDDEGSKSGIKPEELFDFADAVAKLPRLRLRGLMAIPAPAGTHEARLKPLKAMRELFDALRAERPDLMLDTLSMGMSADMAEAVEAGATMVRVGSRIFGARDYSKTA